MFPGKTSNQWLQEVSGHCSQQENFYLLQFICPPKVSPTCLMEWGFLTAYHKFNVQSSKDIGRMNMENVVGPLKLKPMASAWSQVG